MSSRARGALLLVCLLLLVGWIGYAIVWTARDTGAPSAPVDAAPAAEGAQRGSPPVAVDLSAASDREPLVPPREPSPEPPPEADLTHAFEFALEVGLRDGFGAPVRGARVYVAPEDCGFSQLPEATDGAGRAFATWPGRTGAMNVRVTAMVHGVLQPIRVVTLRDGEVVRIALPVEGREQSLFALRDIADGEPPRRLSGRQRRALQRLGREPDSEQRRERVQQELDRLDFVCGRSMLFFQAFACTECHDAGRVQPYRTLALAGSLAPGLHPFARFEDLRVRGLGAEELDRRRDEWKQELKERSLEQAAQRMASRGRRGDGPLLTGIVRGVDGEPAANAPVVWVATDGTVLASARTDVAGRYRLSGLAAGDVHVVAGGTQHGIAHLRRVMPNAGEVGWDAQLEATGLVRGRIAGIDARDAAGMRVEFVRAEGDWCAMTTVDDEGWFQAYDVPGTVDCLLWPERGGAGRLPLHHGVSALTDSSAVTLHLDEELPHRARLRVHVGVPPRYRERAVEARLVQLATGRATPLSVFGYEDALTVEQLAAGPYAIEVGVPGLGWTGSAVVQVDGRGLWDLGRLNLPLPGRLRVLYVGDESPLQDGAYTICRRTEAVDVRVDARFGLRADPHGNVAADPDVVELPVGQHVLVWRDGGELRAHEFAIASDRETELWLVPGVPR